MTTIEQQLRVELCATAQWLFDRGHNAPRDGNLSVRLPDGDVLCTPSGVHKGRLEAAQIVRVDFATAQPQQGTRASSELQLHLAFYRNCPDARAVIHAHSPYAVGLSVAGVSLESPVVPEAIIELGGIPTVPYASPTSDALAQSVLPYLNRYRGLILERHGTVVCASSLAKAYADVEVIEHTARITWVAHTAGSAVPIDADETSKLRRLVGAV